MAPGLGAYPNKVRLEDVPVLGTPGMYQFQINETDGISKNKYCFVLNCFVNISH